MFDFILQIESTIRWNARDKFFKKNEEKKEARLASIGMKYLKCFALVFLCVLFSDEALSSMRATHK